MVLYFGVGAIWAYYAYYTFGTPGTLPPLLLRCCICLLGAAGMHRQEACMATGQRRRAGLYFSSLALLQPWTCWHQYS
jgi:hypothetical protein